MLLAIIAGLWPRPIPVEMGRVTRGPLTVTVLEEGKTRIRHRYVISSPVAGFLRRVEHRAGARIEAQKTILAVVEPQPASLLDPRARAETEARVKAAEALKAQRESQLERVRAELTLANKEKERALTLKRSGAIAARDWDAAESKVNVLNREVNAAEFALRMAGHQLIEAQAALAEAERPSGTKADPLEIVAPVDGYVLNVQEESARIIAPGQPIMEIGDPRDLEAEIELLSSDAVGVQPGAAVTIEQWGGPQNLRARVAAVEPGGYTKLSALGVEEQRVKVRVDFLDPLPAGSFLGDRYRVEARIVTWHADAVLQVPTGALFRRGNDWMTFRVEGGRARVRKVEIGRNNGTAAEVRSGVVEGEIVLVHPPDVVSDGDRVTGR